MFGKLFPPLNGNNSKDVSGISAKWSPKNWEKNNNLRLQSPNLS